MTFAAVSDAGPLIHLAEIDSLELFEAFDRLYIPETVYEELERGGVPDGLADIPFELTETDASRDDSTELDPGERAALEATEEHDATLLTDDLAARKAASEANIDVHGSLGVIALGYARGFIDEDEAASRMRNLQREASLFVTDAVVERGIQMLDER